MNKELKVAEGMKYDVRIVDKNVRDGIADPKEYEKHLKSLPDEEANTKQIEVFTEEPVKDETTEEVLTFTSG